MTSDHMLRKACRHVSSLKKKVSEFQYRAWLSGDDETPYTRMMSALEAARGDLVKLMYSGTLSLEEIRAFDEAAAWKRVRTTIGLAERFVAAEPARCR